LVPNHHMNIKWVSEKKLLSIECPSAKHDQINYPIPPPPPPLGFMTKRCVLNTINISCFIWFKREIYFHEDGQLGTVRYVGTQVRIGFVKGLNWGFYNSGDKYDLLPAFRCGYGQNIIN
jgi:hypothetical protein